MIELNKTVMKRGEEKTVVFEATENKLAFCGADMTGKAERRIQGAH